MTHFNIIITHNGEIKTVGKPPFNLPTKTLCKRRLSTITPVMALNPFTATAFKVLRKVFGDDGRVAAWTRTWRCYWKVTILSTGEWSIFRNREDCIAWELEKLNGDVDKWL